MTGKFERAGTIARKTLKRKLNIIPEEDRHLDFRVYAYMNTNGDTNKVVCKDHVDVDSFKKNAFYQHYVHPYEVTYGYMKEAFMTPEGRKKKGEVKDKDKYGRVKEDINAPKFYTNINCSKNDKGAYPVTIGTM